MHSANKLSLHCFKPSRIRGLLLMLALITPWMPLIAAELTPSEVALKEQLGEGTPDPIRLWAGDPPRFAANAPAETVGANAHIRFVSVPTITPYLPLPEERTGRAIIICAGGGYGALDWKTHVVYAAQVFNPKGVAVIGLKYRLRPPNGQKNEDIQAIALLDVKRAVRTVRQRAAEWGIDPRQIGVAGYSAGGNVAMNLAANFEAGDPSSADPIERQSSRPDFAVGLATWHWREKESPFRFPKDAPPVFLVHATNDGIGGGAPIEMPRAIKVNLEKLGVPVKMMEFDEGGHGVGNLIPQRVQHGFAPAKWPELLGQWLDEIGLRAAAK
jgi:acetyl esterase/lipase